MLSWVRNRLALFLRPATAKASHARALERARLSYVRRVPRAFICVTTATDSQDSFSTTETTAYSY